jgi:hypothetical protein
VWGFATVLLWAAAAAAVAAAREEHRVVTVTLPQVGAAARAAVLATLNEHFDIWTVRAGGNGPTPLCVRTHARTTTHSDASGAGRAVDVYGDAVALETVCAVHTLTCVVHDVDLNAAIEAERARLRRRSTRRDGLCAFHRVSRQVGSAQRGRGRGRVQTGSWTTTLGTRRWRGTKRSRTKTRPW